MFEKIKLLRNYLVYIIKAKKTFKAPNKSSILVYDSCGIDAFNIHIKKWKPEILHIRGEEINILMLFFSLFKNGKRQDLYVDEYIKAVKPRLIITFIDNNKNFFSISNRHKSVKTLFIQNGLRSYYNDIFETLDLLHSDDLKNLKVDYMMTFGSNIGHFFLKYIDGNFIPLGSVKNNNSASKNNVNDGLIAYISQFTSNEILVKDELYGLEKFFGQVERPILKVLQSYADLNHKKLMIIPRRMKNSNQRIFEEKYFNNLLDNKADFFNLGEDFDSYDACDVAEVVVSVDSTLAYESIARGNKTAVFSIRSSIFGLKGYDYGWPHNYPNIGPFWSNKLDTIVFTGILDYLFNVDEASWKDDLIKTDFSSIMEYDRDNLSFENTLRNCLGSK
jgi:surface carbohydrate biosynthesis protein